MRLMKKAVGAAVALALSVSMLVGCGSTASSTASSVASSAAESVASSAVSEAASEVDENEAAATQLLKDLTGSYQELWPVILADDYTQTWLDDCTALVGEDNAQAAFDKLFSHTYHYIGMEPVRGLYEFESDDADSGEFTYFFLAPDTSAETYHIEFRYGSDADALGQYDAGDYAYWLASGIFEVVRHGMSREDAKKYIDLLGRYHHTGFETILPDLPE